MGLGAPSVGTYKFQNKSQPTSVSFRYPFSLSGMAHDLSVMVLDAKEFCTYFKKFFRILKCHRTFWGLEKYKNRRNAAEYTGQVRDFRVQFEPCIGLGQAPSTGPDIFQMRHKALLHQHWKRMVSAWTGTGLSAPTPKPGRRKVRPALVRPVLMIGDGG